MSDTNNEQKPAADGLDSLPEKERDETKEILAEIEADSAKKDPPEPKKSDEDKKPEGEDPKDKKPEGDKSKDGDDGKKPEGDHKPESRREPKLIPAWMHEASKDKFAKREKELLDEIAKLSTGKPKKEDADKKPEDTVDVDKEIEALAEKFNIEPDLAKSIIDIAAKKGGNLPPDVREKLAHLDTLRQERDIEIEEAKFSADFDRLIVPLVKKEYGENVPPNTVSLVKEKLKGIAYSKDFEGADYSATPFEVIYRGIDAFRNLVAPEKKGAEEGRGGYTGTHGDETGKGKEKPWLDHELTEDEIGKLSDTAFDEYMEHTKTLKK